MGVTGLLACIAYLPALGLPFISDDYLQIAHGRKFGPMSGWGNLATDALYRTRATSMPLTYWLEKAAGLSPLAFNVVSLALHVLNTWLVLALGIWKPIGWRVSTVAAGFFAVYEGHQEAVVWFAAVPELLVFFFGLASLVMWLLWLERDCRGWVLPSAAGGAFLLALLSKESGVVMPAVFLVTAALHMERWRRIAAATLPMLAVSALYTAASFAGKAEHQHFHDGTFSVTAPVWVTLANSIGRMFWFWGLLSLVAIAGLRPARWKLLVPASAVWVVITFLPYSFIAYMPRVPSRHTYLASAGLALIAGLAFMAVAERRRWGITAALSAGLVLHNVGYLWTKKQRQYLARAEPTEELVRAGRSHNGAIVVRCFPYSQEIALRTLEVGANRDPETVFFEEASDQPAADFCYDRMP